MAVPPPGARRNVSTVEASTIWRVISIASGFVRQSASGASR